MKDIRWKQRFDNFKKAYEPFNEAVRAYKADSQNILYKMALIHAFECVFELSWKTMKDYLSNQGIDARFPAEIIKEAFAYAIIENGEIWSDMLESRNSMSHEYDEEKSEKIVKNIASVFSEAINELHNYFKGKM